MGRLRGALRLALPPLIGARLLWLGVALSVAFLDLHGTSLLDGLRSSLVHWDAVSYLQIADHGYPAGLDYRDAFLPGFPLLVRGAELVLRDGVVSAWVVNLVAQGIGLWFVARLVLAERDRGAAAFATWMIALLPTAVFFVAPFTESTFLAAAAASLYYARQGRIGAASLAAAAAVALRLTGLALLPALLLEQVSRLGPRRARGAAWLLVIPVPLVLYGLYMRVQTGDALALLDANGLPSFGHHVAAPWDGLATTWSTMVTATDGETRSIFAREVAFGLLGLVACAAMWVSTRTPRSLALYCSVAWLMTASLSFWRSEPRYLLALFPAVIVVADLTSHARVARPLVLAVSAVLMCAGVWIYAHGSWLG